MSKKLFHEHKKNISVIFSMTCILCIITFLLCACGTVQTDSDVLSVTAQSALSVSENELNESYTTVIQSDTVIQERDFALTVSGEGETVTLKPDDNLGELLPLLGDAFSYFEVPSCAFHGLDKIYTFNDFKIDTYPDGEIDRIYLISLMSDLVPTQEGLMIGAKESEIVNIYGEPQEMKGNEYIYYRDHSKLGIIVQNGMVAAITYYSNVQ